MGKRKDVGRVVRDFKIRQNRQFFAIGLTLLLLLLLTLLYSRPDLFGIVSKNLVILAQVGVIGAFVAFSARNWRCPSCGKYLGGNIIRRVCGHCGARLS